MRLVQRAVGGGREHGMGLGEAARVDARLGGGERSGGAPCRVGVSWALRCMNAAAAAAPPLRCARRAQTSRSAARASSGRVAAWPACHARRSGSWWGSVAWASARWAARRSGADAFW
ncbi:hypothetical protein ACFQZ4_48855 [Catellatospora coxensis]